MRRLGARCQKMRFTRHSREDIERLAERSLVHYAMIRLNSDAVSHKMLT